MKSAAFALSLLALAAWTYPAEGQEAVAAAAVHDTETAKQKEALGGFSLEAGGETHEYSAAVSFMLAPTEDGFKIQHLHWSSRAAR